MDGFSFYEAQASGAGQYFLDSLYSDIDSLALYAGIHRKKSKDFHWMLSKRFPYDIALSIVKLRIGETYTNQDEACIFW